MENNKSKYIKYAIGEIILVVIGILIALQINNWNEHRKSQLANLQILKRIHKELTMNLKKSNEVTAYYRTIEGDFYKVLHKKLSKEDYKSDASLMYLISSVSLVNILDNEAKNLASFNDNLESIEDSLVWRINNLYTLYKPQLDNLDNIMIDLTNEFIKKQRDTKDWYYLHDLNKVPDASYDYFLNDPFYLNDVSHYHTMALSNHHILNVQFHIEALGIYKDLSSYLELEADSTILKSSDNFLHYVGTYKRDNEVIQIKQQDDKLVYTSSFTGEELFDFYPNNDSLFILAYRFGKLIQRENSTEMIRTFGSNEPKTYVRTERREVSD